MCVVLAALASCKDKSAGPKTDGGAWKLIGSDLQVSGIETFKGPSQTEFAEAVQKNVAGLPRLTGATTVQRLTVRGTLTIAEAQGALALTARARVPGLPQPLTAAVAATGAGDTAASVGTLIDNGLNDLKTALTDLITLINSGEQRWLMALDSPEPDEQILASQLVGQHKVKAAIPPLGRLLTDPRMAVQEAASDALAAIGDQSAVPLLIKGIQRGNIRSEVRAIEAMGRIGGAEAQAYLEMTAVGHEIPEVRRLSQSLLERLTKRKPR